MQHADARTPHSGLQADQGHCVQGVSGSMMAAACSHSCRNTTQQAAAPRQAKQQAKISSFHHSKMQTIAAASQEVCARRSVMACSRT